MLRRAVRLHDAVAQSYLLMRSIRLFLLVKCNHLAFLHPSATQCCAIYSNLYRMKLTVSQFALGCYPLISIDIFEVLLHLFLWLTPTSAKMEALLRPAPLLGPADVPDNRFFFPSIALILHTRQVITQIKTCQRATQCRQLQFSKPITFHITKSTQNWTEEAICQNSYLGQSGKVNQLTMLNKMIQ